MLTLAGLGAGVFGAMQGFEHGAWFFGGPLCALAVVLLIVGYRLMLSRSAATAAAPDGEGQA